MGWMAGLELEPWAAETIIRLSPLLPLSLLPLFTLYLGGAEQNILS